MRAYKLFRTRKDGSISSLFIGKANKLPLGVWLKAQAIKTKGFAFRPGWHSMPKPSAPHLSLRDRAWFSVEIKDIRCEMRPESQGGKWYLSKWIRIKAPVTA